VKVFLDTNVLASALATRGLCADVLREVLRQRVLLISNEVRAELSKALSAKFGIPDRIVKELELFLEREAVTVPSAKPAGKGIRDEADRLILGKGSTVSCSSAGSAPPDSAAGWSTPWCLRWLSGGYLRSQRACACAPSPRTGLC
jgi:hypothetical protein